MMSYNLNSWKKNVLACIMIAFLVASSVFVLSIQPTRSFQENGHTATYTGAASPDEAELDEGSIAGDAASSDPDISISGPLCSRGARSGNTNLNVSAQGTFSPAYLGDTDNEFRFFVSESYDGEYYDPVNNIPEGNGHWDSVWNVTIDSIEFYFDSISFSPVIWDPQQRDPDNNDGLGWLISWNENFYTDAASNRDFRVDVKASGLETGIYQLRLTFKYRLLTNYTTATQKYNFSKIYGNEIFTEVETLNFEVRSCIQSSFQVSAVDENNNLINNGRFYAGAEKQKLRIFFDEDYPGAALEDVEVTLVPSSVMEMYTMSVEIAESMQTIKIDSLSFNTAFYWWVNIDSTVLPGIYHGDNQDGYITVKYSRSNNDVEVNEVERYPIDFNVGYTPIFTAPSTNGMTGEIPPENQITQGITEMEINVDFKNIGNVDFYDVVVGLDLSNSFLQAPYYYDAGSGDLKTDIILSDNSINELLIGESANASFDISIFNNLPKGKYLVPVVYTGWYYNNGTLGDPTGWEETTENEFTIIMNTYHLPPLDTQPHLALEILDTTPYITVEPTQLKIYTAGQNNQPLQFTISNHELYSFRNLTVSIPTGKDSPFEYMESNRSLPYLTNTTIDTLPAGTALTPYQTTFQLVANIKYDAFGSYSVPVEISGWDVYNDHFEITDSLEVSVNPQLPEIIVTQSTNSKVSAGNNFTLEFVVKNIGHSPAYDLEVLFSTSNVPTNTFTAYGSETLAIGKLDINQEKTVLFILNASASLKMGNDYPVFLRFQYKTELDDIYGFNANPEVPIYIHTEAVEPPEQATEVFIVTSVQSPVAKSGSAIILSITVKNNGDMDIVWSEAILVSNSNLFKITIIDNSDFGNLSSGNLGALTAGQEKTLQFNIDVAKSVIPGSDHSFKLLIAYEDFEGNKVKYNNSDWHEITVGVAEEKAPEPKEEDNWELIAVGFLILMAAVIFALLLWVIIRKTGVGVGSAATTTTTTGETRVVDGPSNSPSSSPDVIEGEIEGVEKGGVFWQDKDQDMEDKRPVLDVPVPPQRPPRPLGEMQQRPGPIPAPRPGPDLGPGPGQEPRPIREMKPL